MNDNTPGHFLSESCYVTALDGFFLLDLPAGSATSETQGRPTGLDKRARLRLCGYRLMDRVGNFGVSALPLNALPPPRMPQVHSEFPAANGADSEARSPRTFWAPTLGSMGVVFGDIGTSPLYAFRVALQAASGPEGIITRESVLGVLSLILWAPLP